MEEVYTATELLAMCQTPLSVAAKYGDSSQLFAAPCTSENLAVRLTAQFLRRFAMPELVEWDGTTWYAYCGAASRWDGLFEQCEKMYIDETTASGDPAEPPLFDES